jgi:hypothetical protein
MTQRLMTAFLLTIIGLVASEAYEASSSLVTASSGAGVCEPGATLLFVLGLLLVLVVPRRGLALRPH